jgi:N,N'-diacetyllegionaminate synthase
MKIGSFDTADNVLVIAEIGNNHEGSYALAEQMVGMAVDAGVGAVKFQTFLTEHYVSAQDAERFARLKGFELSFDEFERLSRYTHEAGILFMSTPFDLESARFLGTIADGIKISSGDNTFYPLIEEAARTAKPILISTGLADINQIALAKELVESTWLENGIDQQIGILHCVSSYPTPSAQANLSAIKHLRETIGGTIGYSDHTLGLEAAVIAVAMGARIIEKHFTLDTNYSDFRDHQLSADPNTMAQMVSRISETSEMMGSGVIGMEDCETPLESAIRRSVAAVDDIPAGTRLEGEHITWTRPGGGLEPGKQDQVLGRRLKKDILQGQQILPIHVE